MIRPRMHGDDFAGLADELLEDERPNLAAAMKTSLILFEAEVKLTLSQPGEGRTYQRRSVSHTASAPGAPPAVDTGRLRSSITHDGPEWSGPDRVRGEVGTNVEYGPHLEYGTSRMLPRPFMRPAAEKVAPRIDALLRKL